MKTPFSAANLLRSAKRCTLIEGKKIEKRITKCSVSWKQRTVLTRTHKRVK